MDEHPMTPFTILRNALGVDEGGSCVPIDRKYWIISKKYWETHVLYHE
jgi:hypothetical protein